jgi:hypothetical protein
MGGGGAFFDYDGDSDQDLFFVNGALLSPHSDGLSARGPATVYTATTVAVVSRT